MKRYIAIDGALHEDEDGMTLSEAARNAFKQIKLDFPSAIAGDKLDRLQDFLRAEDLAQWLACTPLQALKALQDQLPAPHTESGKVLIPAKLHTRFRKSGVLQKFAQCRDDFTVIKSSLVVTVTVETDGA